MSRASVTASFPARNFRAANGESCAGACENYTFHGTRSGRCDRITVLRSRCWLDAQPSENRRVNCCICHRRASQGEAASASGGQPPYVRTLSLTPEASFTCRSKVWPWHHPIRRLVRPAQARNGFAPTSAGCVRPAGVSVPPRRDAPRRLHHADVGDRPDPHPPSDQHLP